eukprot:375112_1
MEILTNPRLYMSILPMIIGNLIQSGYNKPDKQNIVSIKVSNDKIYLLRILESYVIYMRVLFALGAVCAVYDTYINNKRDVALSNIIGLSLFSCSYILRYYVIKLMKGQYSFSTTICQNHKLITSGPYQYVRHPAYFASLLRAIGCVLIYDYNLPTVVGCCIVCISQVQSIQFEETALIKKFGTKYLEYTKSVKYKMLIYVY